MALSGPAAPAQQGGAASNDTPTLSSLFADVLHYSAMGRFEIASDKADQLLNHPDLDPEELLGLSEEYPNSIDRLIRLLDNEVLSDRASQILSVIREGEHLQRKDEDRIKTNIQMLGGPPQEEYNATQRLIDSGEYAIPWMLNVLSDSNRESIWPRVIRALPKIGKQAVRPLVESLRMRDASTRQVVIRTLGELGYASAVPYLQQMMVDDNVSPESKAEAVAAIVRIEQRTGRSFDNEPSEMFVRLAEQYYDEEGSVQSDPRLPEANVWYWDETAQFVYPVAVPQRIFGTVMAMRCCERALMLADGNSAASALWAAANIRREARLGMDTESGDPNETPAIEDPTRPDAFPRALYFTTALGARHAHAVLARAVEDRDSPVALGAIAALRRIAGPASLVGDEDYKQALVSALRFPDIVVRMRTALAIAHALPHDDFRGADLVVGVLSAALVQPGKPSYLVIEPDADNRNRIVSALRDGGATVIGEAELLTGLQRVRSEVPFVNAIFLASNVTGFDLRDVLAALRDSVETAAAPIVLFAYPEQDLIAEQLASADPGIEEIEAAASVDLMLDRVRMARTATGQIDLDANTADQLALEAASALERAAIDGKTVLDVSTAKPALISALGSPNEALQIACIRVLGLIPGADAQRAIAQIALNDRNSGSLRLAAFPGLAESGRRFGNQLESPQLDLLISIAFDDPDLTLRTAAGAALGAINPDTERTSRIPLKFHRG